MREDWFTVADVEWVSWVINELADIVEVDLDDSHNDDSWVYILTFNVTVQVNLQGNRPNEYQWKIPIGIGFYPPDSSDSTLLNPGAAIHYFTGTTCCVNIPSGTRAQLTVGHVPSGNYDITADSSTTLLNVKRSVHIP